MHALAGMAGLVALAWLASEERPAVPWGLAAAAELLFALELEHPHAHKSEKHARKAA